MTRRLALLAAVMLVGGLGLGALPAQGRAPQGALIDPGELRAGAAVDVRVDGADYTLLLTDNRLLGPHVTGFEDVRTLGGTVAGVPGSWVRVTVRGDWASGMVQVGDQMLDIVPADGRALVRPESKLSFEPKVIDYEPMDVKPEGGIPVDHIGGCSSFTPHALASPDGLQNGWSTRTVEVAIAADYLFPRRWGANWGPQIVAVMNGVDAVYEQLNIDVLIVDIHDHLINEINATDTGTVLTQTKAHYAAAHSGLSRQAVGVFAGRPTSNALGQANCIGGMGNPQLAYWTGQSYNVNPLTPGGLITIQSSPYVKIHAHEMGHLLNAHHHYANCAEAQPGPGEADPCTLMAPFIELLDEKLGSFERLVMRGWADAENL